MSTISVLIVENNSGKQRIVKFLVVYNNLYLLSLSIEFTVIQFNGYNLLISGFTWFLKDKKGKETSAQTHRSYHEERDK